jgi:hypothetical protein
VADQNPADPHSSERRMTTADLANAGDTQKPVQAARRQNSENATTSPLLPDDETGELRRQWDAIQTSFVDEPRRAVEQADQLVAVAMKRLAEVFSSERSQLESQWDQGDDVSTEDLRIALQRYRAFFGRLLSM